MKSDRETEQPPTLESLQRKIRDYEAILDAAPVMVACKSKDDRFISVNSAFAEFAGLPKEKILGMTTFDLVKQRDVAQRGRDDDLQVIRTGKPVLNHLVKWSGSGDSDKEIWTIYSKLPFYGPDGSIDGTVSYIVDVDDRIKAEERLKESEERFRSIFANSIDGIYQSTPDGRFLNANPALAEMLGYTSPEELIGAIGNIGLQIYANPEDRNRVKELLDENGFIRNFEVQCRKKDGSLFWVVINIRKVTDDHGHILYHEGSSQDITERKMVEDALRASEERFRMILEATSLPVNITRGTDIIYANPSYLEIFGFSNLGDLKRTEPLELFTPESRPKIAENIRRREKGLPAPDSYEVECLRKDGTRFPVLMYLTKARFIDGPATVAFILDITERKRIEGELKKSEAIIRTAIENLPLIFYMIDQDGKFRLSVGAGLKGLGLEQNQVVGQSAFDMYKDVPEITAAIRESLAGKRVSFESHVGNSTYLNTSVPFAPPSGDFTGIVAVALDISEQRRAEEALRNMQKLESLGVLAGGIAHDFNNLMGGIFGYIDMAIEETDRNKAALNLSKAMSAIDRARALTQQLLTFAKGGAPIRNVGRLFPFVQETAVFALSGSNVTCKVDVQKDLWACNFDKQQIGQVIDNIVINAQQAMPSGGTIELSARNISLGEKERPMLPPGGYIKLSIRDYGVGMPRELISRIFDPFFTTKTKGHGLGLAICYSIINRHEGCIDVESEPGKGSTLHIYLPASRGSILPSVEPRSKSHKGSGTFLVMDDEKIIRETMGAMLGAFGYTVVCKENGREAVDFFMQETEANRKIAGMIFDLTIPGGMGGIAAVREIRKSDSRVPVFVASGYAEDPVMKNPSEHGFTASICKPFMRSELVEMLDKYVRPER